MWTPTHFFDRGRGQVKCVEVLSARGGDDVRAAGSKGGLSDGKVVQVDALDLGVAHPVHLHSPPLHQ